MRTKEFWTRNIDDAVNFPFERFIRQGEEFLKCWADYFGTDYEAEKKARQNRIDDQLTLGIIDKCYPMSIIENFRYLESLKRLAQSGKIQYNKRAKKWRIQK